MSLSFALLALGLSTVANARTLSKKSIKWDACPELNQNVTKLLESSAPVDPFECGTLSVPLDYTDPESEPLQLDLFRVKATKEPVLGTILFNPGGPGGAGALGLPSSASDLRANVGEQYHLLSWDPRGTGNTIPFVCSELAEDNTQQSQKRDVGTLVSTNLTEFFLNGGWELQGEIADSCVSSANATAPLIGTAFGARDMLEIVDALCEDGLLRYYGLSYGTVLGSYFAAMFPERVERMVLDGNVDPRDYRDGHYGDNIRDADVTFAGFLDACLENKDECALATLVDANSTQDMYDAINAFLEPLAASSMDSEEAFTLYFTTKSQLLSNAGISLYNPSLYPALAELLATTLNTSVEDIAVDDTSETEAESNATSWTYGQAIGAAIGIRGADATWIVDSAEEYLPQVEFQANVSSLSDVWYSTTWISAQWKMPAKERYYGDFKATTKHPILYVNGEHDPVTPLAGAQAASEGFEGSVVLAHSGFGHGIFVDPSTCVQEHVRAYFKDGVLPEAETHCEPDLGIWELAKARNGKILGALPPS